jgi:tetratricopeptide (TPR) repeat protein
MVTLYDGKPVPKVIDFGVAKATEQKLTERTLFTQYGTMVGTLEYMSPEQAEMSALGVDTRSDIYSLGVLLYELLTGSTPLSHKRMKEAAYAEILRLIKEEEPPKPSRRLSDSGEALASISAQRHMEPAKLTKLVRGELDWIVMKTLEKDRNRRYETANAFAADVQRYLNDETVQACPPSAWYRFRKFVQRNKGPAVAVSIVALALVGSIIGTTWGLVRAERALDAERKAKDAEIAQRRRAEDNAKLAIAVLDEIIMKEARQRVTLYTGDRAKGLAGDTERDKLEHEFLQKGLRFYEQLARTNATDWAARRERAKAYANVGFLQVELKNFAESEKATRQAVDLMEELAGERPEEFDNAYELADTYLSLAWTYWMTRRLQLKEEVTRHALALLEKLAADFPGRRSQVEEAMAHGQRRLGDVLQATGKLQEAEKAFRAAITFWEIRAAKFPEVRDDRVHLSWNYDGLGQILQATGQVNEAEKAYRQALAIWERLGTDGPEREYALRDGARLLGAIASLLAAAKRTREAEEAYRQAQANWEKLVADFPGEPGYRSHLLGILGALAENLLQQGKHAEAANVAEKMAGALPKAANGYQSAALVLAGCMALAGKDATLSEADRKATAQAYTDRARELIQEAAKRGLHTPVARELREALRLPLVDPQAHYKLGTALHKQGQYGGAETEFREALRLRPGFPEARAKLGYALWKLGKNAEAESECREALRLRPGDPEAYFTLGLVRYWGRAKPAAAARFYAEAFAAHPKLADDLRFPNRYNAACSAALAGCGQGKDAAGIDDAERARVRRQALDWLRADLAAWCQLLEKDPDQARSRVQWALRIWQPDADFAGMRGDALAKLPEAERQAWQQLWADVEKTLREVTLKDTRDTKTKSPN